tara:strand:+ start:821 stop:1042 length:222 start_codon:yes stop_codon:yes gene_type:complete
MFVSPTQFTADVLAADYDFVADYADLTAYRAKYNGLLRIIDNDSGHCILAMGGNVYTNSIGHAKEIADRMMGD